MPVSGRRGREGGRGSAVLVSEEHPCAQGGLPRLVAGVDVHVQGAPDGRDRRGRRRVVGEHRAVLASDLVDDLGGHHLPAGPAGSGIRAGGAGRWQRRDAGRGPRLDLCPQRLRAGVRRVEAIAHAAHVRRVRAGVWAGGVHVLEHEVIGRGPVDRLRLPRRGAGEVAQVARHLVQRGARRLLGVVALLVADVAQLELVEDEQGRADHDDEDRHRHQQLGEREALLFPCAPHSVTGPT